VSVSDAWGILGYEQETGHFAAEESSGSHRCFNNELQRWEAVG
jgi:hypothetical protein